MRVLLASAGTRGDVQPFIALARALAAQGVEARVCTHLAHRARVEAAGCVFVRLAGNPWLLSEGPLADAPLARAIRGELVEPRPWLALMGQAMAPFFPRMQEDVARALADADALVVSPFLLPLARAAGERPWAVGAPVPWLRTSAFQNPWTPWRCARGSLLRRLSYTVPWDAYGAALQGRAQGSYLDQAQGARVLLDGYSGALAPRPEDAPARMELTGPWTLEAPALRAPEVEAFLDEGPPPLLVVLSRIVGRRKLLRVRAALEPCLRRRRLRVLWQDDSGLPVPALPGLRACPDLPHERLLPRCAAVLHYGGAGTTHAAARAGTPQLLLPCLGDQPFWAERAHLSGLSPAPVLDGELSPRALDAALARALEDPALRRQCETVRTRVLEEEGAPRAARRLREALA